MGRDVDTVDADTPLSALGDRMLDDRRTTYAVTEDGAVVGIVSLSDLKGRHRRGEGPTTVGAVMREVHRLHPDADAFEAITGLGAAGASSAVVEEDGRLVGLVTESDLGHALRVRRGFDAGLPG
jgi:CBS domain-containing protein